MTIYKRTAKKYNGDVQQFAKLHETVAFGGRAFDIYQAIDGDTAFVGTDLISVAATLSTWEPATEDEWNAALARVVNAEAKREKERARKADELTYGIEVKTTRNGLVDDGCRRIVRATRVTLFDSGDSQWSRKDGIRKTGRRSYDVRRIDRESLAEIEAFLAGREKVDIVAERKKAAQD